MIAQPTKNPFVSIGYSESQLDRRERLLEQSKQRKIDNALYGKYDWRRELAELEMKRKAI